MALFYLHSYAMNPVTKTKNKSPKVIPMNEILQSLFKNRQGQGNIISISGYIFATSNGTRISARNHISEYDKAVAKAGIENFRFHDLRNTCATWMIQNGVDIYNVLDRYFQSLNEAVITVAKG